MGTAPDTILTAWLYQVTRRTAIDVIRSEARRQLREQIATEMNAMNATTNDWTHIEPLLDEAMHALDETTAPPSCCVTSRTNPSAKSAQLSAHPTTPRKNA